jgi:hypothetical protein
MWRFGHDNENCFLICISSCAACLHLGLSFVQQEDMDWAVKCARSGLKATACTSVLLGNPTLLGLNTAPLSLFRATLSSSPSQHLAYGRRCFFMRLQPGMISNTVHLPDRSRPLQSRGKSLQVTLVLVSSKAFQVKPAVMFQPEQAVKIGY